MDLQQLAVQFLSQIHPIIPPNTSLLIWHALGDAKTSHWFPSVAEAAAFSVGQEAGEVYFGCCLGPAGLPPNRRATASQVVQFPGTWMDHDFGKNHKKPGIPPTDQDAWALIRDVPIRPTVVVFSGHGYQPWWVLSEPWVITDPVERARAADLSIGWQKMLIAKARERGYTIDSTYDLARVLRVPGTWNRKDPQRPVQVEVVEWNLESRPRIEELREACAAWIDPKADELQARFAEIAAEAAEPGRSQRRAGARRTAGPPEALEESETPQEEAPAPRAAAGTGGPGLVVRADAQPDWDLLNAALANHDEFRVTWEHKRDDLPDQSPSGYDLSLANYMRTFDWPEQAIVDALITWRRLHGHKAKLRLDYYQRTLERSKDVNAAREQWRKKKREQKQKERNAKQGAIRKEEEPKSREEAIGRLNEILFGLPDQPLLGISRSPVDVDGISRYHAITSMGLKLLGTGTTVAQWGRLKYQLFNIFKTWPKEQTKWTDTGLQVLLKCCEDVTDEGINNDNAIDWIDRYLQSVAIASGVPENEDAGETKILLAKGHPFFRVTKDAPPQVCLLGWHFCQWLHGLGIKITPVQAGSLLRNAGMTHEQVTIPYLQRRTWAWCASREAIDTQRQ